MSRHSDELMSEIERIASLKAQIPRYKVIAAQYGVSMQTVRRLVFEAMHERIKIRVHVEQRDEKIERIFRELTDGR